MTDEDFAQLQQLRRDLHEDLDGCWSSLKKNQAVYWLSEKELALIDGAHRAVESARKALAKQLKYGSIAEAMKAREVVEQ